MKDIIKNRVIIWLVYLICFFCMGFWAVLAWSVIQVMLCKKETNRHVECEKAREQDLKWRSENGGYLTETEKNRLGRPMVLRKIAEGKYVYERE